MIAARAQGRPVWRRLVARIGRVALVLASLGVCVAPPDAHAQLFFSNGSGGGGGGGLDPRWGCLAGVDFSNMPCTGASIGAVLNPVLNKFCQECLSGGSVPPSPTICDPNDLKDLPPGMVVGVICAYFNANPSCKGNFDCSALAMFVGDLLGRPLTDDELRQLIECSGCTASGCDPNNPCSPSLPGNCDVDGDGTGGTCDDLKMFVVNARICKLEGCGEPPSDGDLSGAICQFMQSCGGGGVGDCFAAIRCVASVTPITPGLIRGLVGCGSCELCGDCKPGTPSNCDLNGDGTAGDCGDLMIILVLTQACYEECNGTPPGAGDLAPGLCAYLSQCTSASPGGCAAMVSCLLEITTDPVNGLPPMDGEAICGILQDTCSGCLGQFCQGPANPGDPPTVTLPCDANGDGVLSEIDIQTLVIMIQCCAESTNPNGDPPLTDAQLRDALCAILEGCTEINPGNHDAWCEALEFLDVWVLDATGGQLALSPEAVELLIDCLSCAVTGEGPTKEPGGGANLEDGNVDQPGCGGGSGGGSGKASKGTANKSGPPQGSPPSANPSNPSEGNQSGATGGVLHHYDRDDRFPITPYPVNLATGCKEESVTDVAVAVPGGSYAVSRSYTSSAQYTGASLVGNNWMASGFWFVLSEGSGNSETVTLYGPSVAEKRVYSHAAADSAHGLPERWQTTGPAQQYFVKADPTVWGQTFHVWRLTTPGGEYTDFFRATSASTTPAVGAELLGLPWRTVDVYGRGMVYDYLTPNNTDTNTPFARLSAVYLGVPAAYVEGSAGMAGVKAHAQAVVSFWWLFSQDATVSGKLKQVSVYRRENADKLVETNRVEYLYKRDNDGLSGNLGTHGDLIQVVSSVLLNDDDRRVTSSKFYSTVMQYRYHGGTSPGSGWPTDAAGGAHQIKMVIAPAQIEYVAQNLAAQAQSPYALLPLDQRLATFAGQLLHMGDVDPIALMEPSGPDVAPSTTSVKVLDLASKIVGYEGSASPEQRVATQYVLSGCGCSGGSQGTKLTYTYSPSYGSGSTARSTMMREFVRDAVNQWTPYRDHLFDMASLSAGGGAVRITTSAIAELTPSGTSVARGLIWTTHYEYDTSDARHLLAREFTAAACAQYNPVFNVSGTFTAPSSAVYTPKSAGGGADQGLVYGYAYTWDGRPTEVRISNGNRASISDFDLLTKVTYGANGTSGQRAWLPLTIERVRTGSTTLPTNANDIETTTYQYGLRSSPTPDSVAWIKVTEEAERQEENGPNSSSGYATYTLYDADGRVRWERSATNTLTYFEYDDATSALTKVVRNAAPNGLSGGDYAGLDVSGWGHTALADGGELTTAFQVDRLGRTVMTTTPGGVHSYTIRTMATATDRPGLPFFQVVTLPHPISQSPLEFDGPARFSIFDASAGSLESTEFALQAGAYDPTLGHYSARVDAATQKLAVFGRSTAQRGLTGLTRWTKRWYTLDACEGTKPYYTDQYAYDALGRTERVTNANNTVTSYKYDVLDRTVEVGTGTSTSGISAVATSYYDATYGTSSSPTSSPVPGVGNGNVTHVVAQTGDATLGMAQRHAIRKYDFRGRLEASAVAGSAGTGQALTLIGPFSSSTYDNLDRVVSKSLWATLNLGDWSVSTRRLYSTAGYSQRGLPFVNRVAIDPDEHLSAPTFLETHTWYDADGQTIASWGPNAPATKRVLDALGRTVRTYVTDRGGDAAPGATNNWNDAASVSGDKVYEQTDQLYSTASTTAWHGQLLGTTALRRPHDSTDTGALSANNAVATYVGYWYDGADRVVRTVNYGTNTTDNVLKLGGTQPTWPPASRPEPNGSGFEIVSAVTYNERGQVALTTDPMGRQTAFGYDALGRQVVVVENYDLSIAGTNGQIVAWDCTLGRWKAVAGISTSTADKNRTTAYVYDGVGNVVQQIAFTESGTTDSAQITQYLYGTTSGSAATTTNSLIDSKNLLKEVRYPNESTGAPGTGSTYTVSYAYNLLGELRSVVDQNGTRHEYLRDAAGRISADRVPVFGSGIDNRVKRLGIEFDDAGRLKKATSYTDLNGTSITNQVQMGYTPLWQIEKVYQDHDGAVAFDSSGNPTGNTQLVSYRWDTKPVGSGNGSVPDRLYYPDGAYFDYTYDASSRLVAIGDNATSLGGTLATYEYLGLDTPAIVYYEMAYTMLDRTLDPPGYPAGTRRIHGGPAGVYAGFDRFGRIAHQAWMTKGLDAHATKPTVPNVPEVFYESYQYDKASNRIGRRDARPGVGHILDAEETFDYDGLDRLKEAKRGRTDGTTWVPSSGSQKWALDVLGNWVSSQRDLAPNASGDFGSYSDSGDERQDHTHSKANEITANVLKDPVSGNTTVTLPFTYDDAGNLKSAKRTDNASYDRAIHDAWNRLVKWAIADSPSGVIASFFTADYEYNALHWRTKVVRNFGIGGETRLMYYTPSWQLIEEHVATTADWEVGPTYHVAQEVFGPRYIDDTIYRRVRYPTGSSVPSSFPNRWEFSNVDDYAFFHLTDVQFSTRAMMKAAADGEVLERVSYDAYGRARHRFDADVNADGAVNDDDYGLINAGQVAIDDKDYDVRYDLNRDGAIDGDDLDVQQRQNKRALAGEGQISDTATDATLDDGPGPDNVFGYCGYVFAPESLWYHVRARWYAPEAGRWVERDPAGYVDGTNLFESFRSSPELYVDPTGLYGVTGHYYTTFLAARCAGRSVQESLTFAYFSQLPDMDDDFDAAKLGTQFYAREHDAASAAEDKWAIEIQKYIHSLDGKSPAAKRDCLEKMVSDNSLPRWMRGIIIHALGDNTAHTDPTTGLHFLAPWGHGNSDFRGCLGDLCTGGNGKKIPDPDEISNNLLAYRVYFHRLCLALGGSQSNCAKCSANTPTNNDAVAFGRWAIRLGHPSHEVDYLPERVPSRKSYVDPVGRIGRPQMQQVIDLIKCRCK